MPLFSERSDKTREDNISISHLLSTLAFAVLSGRPTRVGTGKVQAVCSRERNQKSRLQQSH